MPDVTIRQLTTLEPAHIESLAEVMMDCVAGGASIGFMHPLSPDRAIAFWQSVALGVAEGARHLLIASDDTGICGTVQLVDGLPENQPHRANVAKMMVHRRARSRGVGAALVRAVESLAAELGKSVLVLDAVTDGDAARLYERLGWVRVGDVPNFALYPDGRACSTTYMYRNLPPT